MRIHRQAGALPLAARSGRRSDQSGAFVCPEVVGCAHRPDQPQTVWILVGGLGTAGCARGQGDRRKEVRHRSRACLSDRPFDGRSWDVVHECHVSGQVRGDRTECRVDHVPIVPLRRLHAGHQRRAADAAAVRQAQRSAVLWQTNYGHFGVYIIHGDKDDNVPPQQSYLMMERLKTFHHDFEYHEEPGAGHWWDNSDDPGADCVDWRPLFDFFARHTRPGKDRVRTIAFHHRQSRHLGTRQLADDRSAGEAA